MKMNRYQKLFGVGPLGFAIAFMLLCFLWALSRSFDSARILPGPTPLRTLGLTLILVWICWHIWAIRTIRAWWTGDQLCKTGPFRYVRHPMYAGSLLLFGPGVALLFNSWIVIAWPVFMYPVWSILVRKEERMMLAIFGEEYSRYAAQTGKLFPRLPR